MSAGLAEWVEAELAKLREGVLPETEREHAVYALARRLALEQVLLRLTAPERE